MSFRTLSLGTALVLGLAAAGCNGSSAELDKTKADLAQANQDRNNLKTELDASKTQVAALQSKVTELTGKLAAVPPAKTAEAAHPSVATAQKNAMKVEKKDDKNAHKTGAKPQKG